MNLKPTPPPAGDGSIELMGHHIPPATQVAAAAALLLLAGWCLLVPRVRHLFRRLAICAAVAAAGSAVFVGWHDHAHHARLAAAAAASHDTVPRQVLTGWAGLTLGVTAALFAASGWWLRARAQGRLAWAAWPPRRRRTPGPVYLPGTGRPAGRAAGMPPGYEAGPPYGGLPPGFPPPGAGGRR